MSRHGYVDDFEDNWQLIRWRGAVNSAIRGARGQQLLRDMRDALDAMPVKELCAGDLIDEEGSVCALGAVGVARKIPNLELIDPEEYDAVAKAFDIAPALAREIAYENDEEYGVTTDALRWQRMRRWVERHIIP